MNRQASRSTRIRRVTKPEFRVSLLEEPDLIFGEGQPESDPKVGLYNFGPYSVADDARHPQRIRLGITGSGSTVGDCKAWLSRIRSSIEPVARSRKQVTRFPGFSDDAGRFNCAFAVDPACVRELPKNEIEAVTETLDRRRAFEMGLELVLGQVRLVAEDHHPDVIVVALPQRLYDVCRAVGGPRDKSARARLTPAEKALQRLARKQKQSSQALLFEDLYRVDAEEQLVYRNFRRALKARVMQWGVPIQIMRPSSFFDESGHRTLADKISALRRQAVQEPATRAWNFCSAMYFKANGVPWRLAGIRPGTCFVGISFFRHDTVASPHMHTSVGQVFTDQGDALVIRGDRFEWDVAKRGSPHLSRTHAKQLVETVVQMYENHVHAPPTRLVIHKSSRYADDERAGFIEGIRSSKVAYYDLVALYSRGVRLFREGTYPPVRGTLVRLPEGGELLYTMGYIPQLDTYPKGHVPRPLEIIERIGDSDLRTVAEEILGLSKLNWNSADFAGTYPITLRFSRRVGDVLTELGDDQQPHPHYRFYI